MKISALNPLQNSLGTKIRKLGEGATQFFLGIPQFHFHFSRVDFLLREDDTALQNSKTDPQKSRLHLLRMFKLQYCTKFGQLILRKIIKNFCHQMSYFKAKMHQIRFRLGLRLRARWGAHSALPDTLARFKGSYF